MANVEEIAATRKRRVAQTLFLKAPINVGVSNAICLSVFMLIKYYNQSHVRDFANKVL